MGILELSLKYAVENTKEEGKKIGRKIGREEGRKIGIKLTLKTIELLKQKKSPSKIAKELDLDITLVKRIAAAIK